MVLGHTISRSQSSARSAHHWYHILLRRQVLTPLRIALIYAIVGLGLLYLSDVVFVRYFSEPFLSQIQTLKGGVEIFGTAGLIFLLTHHYGAQLETRADQIDQQREELSVLHRVLRHNLRNDANVIMGYADVVAASTELDTECERIQKAASKLVHYTEQARRINKITEENGRVDVYDLATVIPDVLDGHPSITDDVQLTTELPPEATVESNRMLHTAIKELVTNAIEHNDDETSSVTIEVSQEDGPPHMTELRIIDNGPGIPEKELDPLRTGSEEQLVHLSGLGLWFVTWTVEHSQGELIITDAEDGGTLVRMWLPKAFALPMEMDDLPG